MKNKNLALVLATALVLGACGNEAAKPNEEGKPAETETTDNNNVVKEVSNDTETAAKDQIPATEKTLEEAIDAFYTHYGDDAIELTGADLDEEDGKYIYSVKGYKDGEEFEAEFDANSLDLIKEERETEDDTNILAIEKDNIIIAKEAMEKALEGQEGAWVKEYELEVENGKAIYDIDIEDGKDIKIDAATGEIL